MIRIVKMSGKYYGKRIDFEDENDLDEINTFVLESTPCILVDELDGLYALDIDESEVIMVD